ncbi:SDR family oxidoreductase [Nocardia fusca]|uniref:SDR family NAD(P)-dependent oxidoreductase n=1 Tax=Nocardia fusca TaxID=941183 RepID=UPI0007A75280
MSTDHAVAVVVGGASGIGWATAQHGPLDTIVDCAGISRPGTLTDLSLDDWKATVDVCLTGAFLTVREAAHALRDHGSVVLVASLNGRRPGVGMGAYCSTKAGVLMLTEVAAMELAPRGIRVNAVNPGFVHTPLTHGATLVPGLVEEYIDNTPLGRAGTPGDTARTTGFLTSAAARLYDRRGHRPQRRRHTERYPDIVARAATAHRDTRCAGRRHHRLRGTVQPSSASSAAPAAAKPPPASNSVRAR